MATDSNFCLRRALIRTFADSDVLLSKVAQNDAKYIFGVNVTQRRMRMVMDAQETFFRVLKKRYFITEQEFLELLMSLIRQIREFSKDSFKRELLKFDYRGDLLSLDEHKIVVVFIQEFSGANDAESLDDVYNWIRGNKDHHSKVTYDSGKAAMFRDSEFLKLLLRIFAN